MWRKLLLLILFAAVGYFSYRYSPFRDIRHAPGVLVPMDPVQVNVTPYILGNYNGYELTARAEYTITSRVLSTRSYAVAPHHDLVPMDVAVGWGRMSDQAVLDQLDVSQSARFFFYEWESQPPIPKEEIICHAANMHVIPATPEVERTIWWLKRGDVATMTGMLVDARGSDGFVWPTSMTRNDTGPGACELFFVRSVTVKPLGR